MIKRNLFFDNLRRKEKTQSAIAVQSEADKSTTDCNSAAQRGVQRTAEQAAAQENAFYSRNYGRVEPNRIPESGAWWRTRQAELMALSDDSERGMMTGMITST